MFILGSVFMGWSSLSMAQDFDAAHDFKETANGGDGNPWTYSSAITFGGPGVAKPMFADISGAWGFPQSGWTGNGESWENWASFEGAPTETLEFETGDLITHGNTGLVFTSPRAGTYEITVSSWMGRDMGRTVLGKLMLNDNQENPLAQKFYDYSSGSRDSQTEIFYGSQLLRAGETLRLDIVGWNSDGGEGGTGQADFVGVNFKIKLK